MLAERAAGAGLEHTPSTVPVPVLRSHSLHGSGKTVARTSLWAGPPPTLGPRSTSRVGQHGLRDATRQGSIVSLRSRGAESEEPRSGDIEGAVGRGSSRAHCGIIEAVFIGLGHGARSCWRTARGPRRVCEKERRGLYEASCWQLGATGSPPPPAPVEGPRHKAARAERRGEANLNMTSTAQMCEYAPSTAPVVCGVRPQPAPLEQCVATTSRTSPPTVGPRSKHWTGGPGARYRCRSQRRSVCIPSHMF